MDIRSINVVKLTASIVCDHFLGIRDEHQSYLQMNVNEDGVFSSEMIFDISHSSYKDPRKDARDYLDHLKVSFQVSSAKSYMLDILLNLCNAAKKFLTLGNFWDINDLQTADEYEGVTITTNENSFTGLIYGNYEGTMIKIEYLKKYPEPTVEDAISEFFKEKMKIAIRLGWDLNGRIKISTKLPENIIIYEKQYHYTVTLYDAETDNVILDIEHLKAANEVQVEIWVEISSNNTAIYKYRLTTNWVTELINSFNDCGYATIERI